MMTKIFLAAALVSLTSGTAFAAGTTATATGTATASVVAPISITHASGAALDFGKFTAGNGGMVVVSTSGGGTATGDVAFVSGNSNAADRFSVTGDGGRQFNITASSGNKVSTGGTSSSTMPFSLNIPGSATLSTAGAYTLNVGGTLTVSSGQAAGAYTGSYTVTVAYQ